MFRSPFNGEPDNLDLVINDIHAKLLHNGLEDKEEYSELLSYLVTANKVKNENRSRRVSPDTVALVVGNLLGILVIVAYEQKHVMTSKGLGFILKAKT